jgi:hypothetical protein
VWVLAAVGKARTPVGTRAAVERLVRAPAVVVGFIARVVVPVELVLGVMLIARWHARAAAGASGVLFLVFALVLARAVIRDSLAGEGRPRRSGGCGCFGGAVRADPDVLAAGPALDSSALTRSIARNLVLVALAVAAAFGG